MVFFVYLKENSVRIFAVLKEILFGFLQFKSNTLSIRNFAVIRKNFSPMIFEILKENFSQVLKV